MPVRAFEGDIASELLQDRICNQVYLLLALSERCQEFGIKTLALAAKVGHLGVRAAMDIDCRGLSLSILATSPNSLEHGLLFIGSFQVL